MKKGQLMIEVIIAISVAMVAIVGLVQVATRSVNNSGSARRQSEATTYGTEALEWVVAQKDLKGWEDFEDKAGTYCFGVSPPGDVWPEQGDCDEATLGNPVQYTRTVNVSNISANEMGVDVTVSWNEGDRVVSSKQSRTVGRY
jgi:Tfp pilus assembly protein PilV